MTTRVREVAVRSALGAGRAAIARQLLTDSLLVSVLGGLLGLLVASWGTDEVMRMAGAYIPRSHEVGFDARIFLFLTALCAVTSIALGVAPAMFAARTNLVPALQESGGHATISLGQRRLRDALVVAEVAMAFVLAVGATLLIRELVRLRQVDTGMVAEDVITFHLGHRMTPETDVGQFYGLEERVSAIPGVRAAGLTQMLPLQNWGWTSNSTDFTIQGRPPSAGEFPIELRYVTPGYFRAMGVTLKQGREFTDADSRDGPRVIAISESLARRTFGDENPIGLETSRGTVVAIVADVRQVSLDQPASPEIYFPVAQNWSQLSELGMTLVVSTRGEIAGVTEQVRSAVREVNSRWAIFNVKRMDEVVAESVADFTLCLSLIAAFAALALVLAMTGAYGVISYIATARSREFAIRVAIGARRKGIVQLVLWQGIVLTALGIALGVALTLAFAPLLQGLPVSVRPPDLATTAPVALVIGAVAVVACLIPAGRASLIDPVTSLRD
jgi:predicted permease